MKFTRESAVERAKTDLADRLKIDAGEIAAIAVEDREFSDMSLGAPAKDEMAAQMISNGWQIKLGVGAATYEYRADKYQLRLHEFFGENYLIEG